VGGRGGKEDPLYVHIVGGGSKIYGCENQTFFAYIIYEAPLDDTLIYLLHPCQLVSPRHQTGQMEIATLASHYQMISPDTQICTAGPTRIMCTNQLRDTQNCSHRAHIADG